MGAVAVWSIAHNGNVVAFSQSASLADAYTDARDWLYANRFAWLNDDEWAVSTTTYVNPTVADIRDYTITTELA